MNKTKISQYVDKIYTKIELWVYLYFFIPLNGV